MLRDLANKAKLTAELASVRVKEAVREVVAVDAGSNATPLERFNAAKPELFRLMVEELKGLDEALPLVGLTVVDYFSAESEDPSITQWWQAAKRAQGIMQFEQASKIVNDLTSMAEGKEFLGRGEANGRAMAADKVLTHTRWQIAKLLPKTYGTQDKKGAAPSKVEVTIRRAQKQSARPTKEE